MPEFLHNAPVAVFLQALHSESAARGYTDLGARISLYLDVDKGKVKKLSDYARIWGWEKGTLYKRWQDITRDVWDWSSSGGRQPDRETAKRYLALVPPTSKAAFLPADASESEGNAQETFGNAQETKNGDSRELEGGEETTRKRFGNAQETHTNHPLPSNHQEEEKDVLRTSKKKATFTAAEIEQVYQAYPRLVGKQAALKAIKKALHRIADREGVPDPVAWLVKITERYAGSPAGNQGSFTPHPQKWFNQGRYDDDPAEWHHADNRNGASHEQPQRSPYNVATDEQKRRIAQAAFQDLPLDS